VRTRPWAAAAVAAAFAAAACRGSKGASDSAAVTDTAAAACSADSAAKNPPLPAPGAPGAAPSPATGTQPPNAVVKPRPSATTTGGAKTPPATSKRPTEDTSVKPIPVPDVTKPIPTSPAPGNQAPAGATTPALVVFRDSVTSADLDWVRGQGFTIVNVNRTAHAVSVSVPDGYRGNPKANPRILRFVIAMR
jgi:hypothetical protein